MSSERPNPSEQQTQLRKEIQRLTTDTSKIPWDRFIYWLLSVALFALCSTWALGYALGYRYNFTERTWQQTGVIRINGPLTGLPVAVFVDGQQVSEAMPVRLSRVLPGAYTIELRKDGYTSWSRSMVLEPNQRISFTDAVLVYAEPKEALASGVTATDQRFTSLNNRGLEVRNGNELWIEGTFVTRRSDDIFAPRWFPIGSHVLFQLGSELVLYDVYGKATQSLLRLSTADPVAFFATDGGRRIIVNDGELIRSYELYEQNTILNRLVVDY